MATAHEIAVITNSCVKAPVNSKTGLSTTFNERSQPTLSSTWQGKSNEFDFDKENQPFFQTTKSVNFDTDKTLEVGPDLSTLTDDEFYQRLVTLKEEHKKTLQLCESLYNEKLSQLKDASPPRGNSKSVMSKVSVSRDFSMSPQNTYNEKSHEYVRRSRSPHDQLRDYSSKPPTGRSSSVEQAHNGWVNANGTPISEKEEALYRTAAGRKLEFDDQNDSFNESKVSNYSKISDMWENFSVDDYAPHTKPRPQSASFSKTASSKSKENAQQKKEWKHKITVPKPFNMTLRDTNKTPTKTKAMIEVEEEMERKFREEEAECQKKFKAKPVPAHVYMPLYDEIYEEKETRRRFIKEHSEEVLQSQVKPFKFTKREEVKKAQNRETRKGSLEHYDKQKKKGQFKANPYPSHIFDENVSHKIKEEEEYRKIRVQMRSEELLKSASLPPTMAARGQDYVDGKTRQKLYAERAKKAGFTPEHKFKPNINEDMPDFDELHRKYMKEVAQRKAAREATVCKPFTMRTERLKREQNMYKTLEKEPGVEHDSVRRRPHSAPRLSFAKTLSTSMDAIPARVTKATDLRSSANKEKLQRQIQSELEELEKARKKRLNEERLKKTIKEKAMANDRTSVISKDRSTKLKEYKESDRARQQEYRSQLNEMKERVEKRPFLFERTAQENAIKAATKRYQDTLSRAGLNEDFVNTKGKAASGSAHTYSNDQISDDEDSYMKSYSNKQSGSKLYSDDNDRSYGDRTQSEEELDDESA